MVALLLAEQADEVRLALTNPVLQAAQKRLRDQLQTEGDPCIQRLMEISATADFRAIQQIRDKLDLSKLQTSVSSDLVGTFDSQLRQFFALYTGTLNGLEAAIPKRIAALTTEDVEPVPPGALSFVDCISRDIKSAAGNVTEVESRLESLKRLVERVMNAPGKSAETFRSVPAPNRPAFQITAE